MSALCGQGVKEAYDAILALGGRQGMGQACLWPERKSLQFELNEVIGASESPAWAEFFREGFDKFVAQTNVRDPTYDCKGYLAKTEKSASNAMARWHTAVGKTVTSGVSPPARSKRQ
jgi:hypothetical protein